MILVDTSVWFAAHVEEDPQHAEADALLTAPSDRLVTTDYIIDELLTLLVTRGHRPIAKTLGRLLWSGAACEIIWVARGDIEAAWQVFDSFDDKKWSFTDCVSYAVMKRLGIREAFALDEHFKQFGFVTVKPCPPVTRADEDSNRSLHPSGMTAISRWSRSAPPVNEQFSRTTPVGVAAAACE